jgi:hypothetical protein
MPSWIHPKEASKTFLSSAEAIFWKTEKPADVTGAPVES